MRTEPNRKLGECPQPHAHGRGHAPTVGCVYLENRLAEFRNLPGIVISEPGVAITTAHNAAPSTRLNLLLLPVSATLRDGLVAVAKMSVILCTGKPLSVWYLLLSRADC